MVEQEESKDQPSFDLVGHTSAQAQVYVNASKLVRLSLEEEIDTLLAQKQVQLQQLAKLGKSKSKFETMILDLVTGFSN
jgi:hypothetical protein